MEIERKTRRVGAIVLGALVATGASAGTQEAVDIASVEIFDALGDPGNTVLMQNITGGYAAGTVHLIGTWSNTSGSAHPYRSRVRLFRAMDNTTVDLRFNYDFTQSPVSEGQTLYVATADLDGVDPAGMWEIEFYAEIDQAPDAVDATFTDVRLEFEDQTVEPNGADVTLCEVYGITMNMAVLPTQKDFARVGDVVGLTMGTTSWNVGDRNLIWFAPPDERHPMIAMNVYRKMDGRMEQIGIGWVKHGFNALSNDQCGGFCNPTSPGIYLGVGCTDTYRPSTNGRQSDLGPRFEIDPWAGTYDHPTSFLQTGIPGGDTPITRRIQVHDDDLDPAMNMGATYYMETLYITPDDVDVMNNAAHKEFSVAGIDSDDQWLFTQSGQTDPILDGFAIESWAGARRTMLAQELPVNEFTSPDGRCLLSVVVTDNMDGTWRYEYALLNIDMDRQVGRFEVEASPGVTISNIGFHAPLHHDEPTNAPVAEGGVPIDNAPWASSREAASVKWETTTNPLRWGTMMNFWFDADAPPADADVDLGLFRTGIVTQVSGVTDGPILAFCLGDANSDGVVNFADITRVLEFWNMPGADADANGDGEINFADVTTILQEWNVVCD